MDYPALIDPAGRNPGGPSLSFYNLAEAHVLAATRQKWVFGTSIEKPDKGERPLFGRKPRAQSELQISMQAIRNAIDYVRKENPKHPLISQYFYTDGKQLFVKTVEDQLGGGIIVNVSRLGQLGLPAILEMYLQRIERDHEGWPLKVYPLRDLNVNDRSIVIIPNVASGRPTINGTGIRVEVIWNRSQAGETAAELAEDYGIEPRVIEKAISYFTNVKAA